MPNEVSPFWKEFSSDFLYRAVSRALPTIAALVGMAVFTRLLSPTEYGIYSLAVAAVGLSSTVFYSWINASVFRFAREHATSGDLFATAWRLHIIIAFAVVAIGVGVYLILLPGMTLSLPLSLYVLSLLLLPVSCFLNLGQSALQGLRRISSFAYVAITHGCLRVVAAAALLLWVSRTAVGVITGYTIGAAVAGMLALWLLHRGSLPLRGKISPALVRDFAHYGIPLIGVFGVSWVLSLSDRYLVAYFWGAGAAGIYTAGYQAGSYLIMLPSSLLVGTMFPISIELYTADDHQRVGEFLEKSAQLLLFILFPLLWCALFLPDAIMTLFGRSYSEASAIVLPVTGGHLLLALAQLLHKSFELSKKTTRMFLFMSLAALINVILNLGLIPVFGSMVAAWTTLVAYGVYLGLVAARGARLLDWRFPWFTLTRCAVCGFAAYAPAFLVWRAVPSIPLIVLCVVFLSLVYLLALCLWRERAAVVIFRTLTKGMIRID